MTRCNTSYLLLLAATFKVNLQDGAVRLPIAWDAPAQHFALVGDLLLRIKSEGSKMTFEQIAMPNASLRRVSVSDSSEAQNRLLCEKLSFFCKVVSEKQVLSGWRFCVLERLAVCDTWFDFCSFQFQLFFFSRTKLI